MSKKTSITSMVLGIVGLCCICGGYSAVISIVLGILAMNFSKKAVAEVGENGFNKAGKITGLIATILGGITFLVVIIVCSCALAMGGAATAGAIGSSLYY